MQINILGWMLPRKTGCKRHLKRELRGYGVDAGSVDPRFLDAAANWCLAVADCESRDGRSDHALELEAAVEATASDIALFAEGATCGATIRDMLRRHGIRPDDLRRLPRAAALGVAD